MEKESTTPDQYPLTLNSLTLGCNQKSNRDPVMTLSDEQVQEGIDLLNKQGLILESRAGSRVAKYKHRFCNTEFSALQFTKQEKAVIGVMLLRGPQTPGELRTRTGRMCEFDDVHDVEKVLTELTDKSGEVLVKRLPREAGKRESRYVQLFSVCASSAVVLEGDDYDEDEQKTQFGDQDRRSLEQRVEILENELAALKTALADLL